jgi:hypothetical protein
LSLVADGEHQFLDVKLPGDYIKRQQLAGLALLVKCVPWDTPVSVGTVSLDTSVARFQHFVSEIKRRVERP